MPNYRPQNTPVHPDEVLLGLRPDPGRGVPNAPRPRTDADKRQEMLRSLLEDCKAAEARKKLREAAARAKERVDEDDPPPPPPPPPPPRTVWERLRKPEL